MPAATGRVIFDNTGAVAATIVPITTAASIPNADKTKTQKDDFPKEFTVKFYGPDDKGIVAIRQTKLTVTDIDKAYDFTYSDAPVNTLVTSASFKSDLVVYNDGFPAVDPKVGPLSPAVPKPATAATPPAAG